MDGPPRIFLVTGIPGAGKTTVSDLLARRFERGVHVEADALQGFIVSGARWPNEEPRDEGERRWRCAPRMLRFWRHLVTSDFWLDTGHMTAADTVEAILRGRLIPPSTSG